MDKSAPRLTTPGDLDDSQNFAFVTIVLRSPLRVGPHPGLERVPPAESGSCFRLSYGLHGRGLVKEVTPQREEAKFYGK